MEDRFEYLESAGISIFIPTSCQLNNSKKLTVRLPPTFDIRASWCMHIAWVTDAATSSTSLTVYDE